jgi:HD superfamily phosphohydrolase
MARPKFFRDPVHGQIGYDAVDLALPPPLHTGRPEASLSWLIRRLIDCVEFQRLRQIRQNGLVNLIYHGAENSRFGHSMGVCHLGREMYCRIVRNMGEPIDLRRFLSTCGAALLHDIGHGPFSHVLEEILGSCGLQFDHEWMTRRLLIEKPEADEKRGASVHEVLRQIDETFPGEVALYINKKWRDAYNERHELVDHWSYKIVSSQMDADRLDYLLRDSYFAGIKGHSFDIQRLLDMLLHLDHTRIAVPLQRLQKRAEDLVRKHLPHVDRSTVRYYVRVDEPERLSYKRYDWRNENPDESIWIVDGGSSSSTAVPIEKEPTSIIAALQTVKYFHRLMVPAEVRGPLLADLGKERGDRDPVS